MARGGGGGAHDPQTRPTSQGPAVPAGGRRCRGGTNEDPLLTPALPAPQICRSGRDDPGSRPGSVTHWTGDSTALTNPFTGLGYLSEKGERPRLDRRGRWVGCRSGSHPTAALTRCGCLTLPGVRKAGFVREAFRGPAACPLRSQRRVGPSLPNPRLLRCAVGALCAPGGAGFWRETLQASEPRSVGSGRLVASSVLALEKLRQAWLGTCSVPIVSPVLGFRS